MIIKIIIDDEETDDEKEEEEVKTIVHPTSFGGLNKKRVWET